MAKNQNFFGISEAARRLSVCENTLRGYAKRGIITPERDYLNRRLFTEEHIQQVKKYRRGQKI